jgi:hypothetical protein
MAKKEKVSADEKFDNQDINLFDTLERLDRKDYAWYDSLSEEQKKKFVPYMLLHWMSAIKGNKDLQTYYTMSSNESANKYMFNEVIQKHPKLQYLMLCAISPGNGKQFHQYIPHLKQSIVSLKEPAKQKDVKEYFTKMYPKAESDLLDEISTEFTRLQKRKYYLSQLFPNLKIADIETLNEIISDEEIRKYESDRGN